MVTFPRILFTILSFVFAWSAALALEPDEAESGSLFLKCSQDAAPVEALRLNTTFRAQVTGNVARVFVSCAAGWAAAVCCDRGSDERVQQ